MSDYSRYRRSGRDERGSTHPGSLLFGNILRNLFCVFAVAWFVGIFATGLFIKDNPEISFYVFFIPLGGALSMLVLIFIDVGLREIGWLK